MNLLHLVQLQKTIETERSDIQAVFQNKFPDNSLPYHFCVHTHYSPIRVSVWRGWDTTGAAQLLCTEEGKLEINTRHTHNLKYTTEWLQNICDVLNEELA